MTVDKTTDEYGQDRYYVCDEKGDWISPALDSREEAQEWIECETAAQADIDRYVEQQAIPGSLY